MYDVVIIGAGMSGLAAGIRLAMFGKQVCILERHYAIGGLNSYYRLDGRNYDVGLHAVTNFAPRSAKHGPLPRLLRQLRVRWDDFELAEQQGSAIAFPNVRLRFSNDPQLLQSEVDRAFPNQRENYQRFLGALLKYDELESPRAAGSSREIIHSVFSEPLLVEMLLCPVMFYGNPREHDMDFGSFSVLFRAIFLEGLARPRGGVRVILKQLVRRFKQIGGELRLRSGVRQILADGNRAVSIVLDDGSEVRARHIMSSAGLNETLRLCSAGGGHRNKSPEFQSGKMTFLESISILDRQPSGIGMDETIVFYNDREQFDYCQPVDFADVRSGIVCSPNNYEYSADGVRDSKIEPTEGTIRLTVLANFDSWASLPEDEYKHQKAIWYDRMTASAARFVPDFRPHIVSHDMFTPTTVVRYTGHDRGAVYGAPQKRYDASTHLENLLICGADQGYVGIVGTLTSGIQVANRLLKSD